MMTIEGTIDKTGISLVILLAAATWTWSMWPRSVIRGSQVALRLEAKAFSWPISSLASSP